MTAHTVLAASADAETLSTLDDVVLKLPAGEVREAMLSVATALRLGQDVIVVGAEEFVTPSQAAKILGVSRTHLYKVLDLGALEYSVVGVRDRRIAMSKLNAYVAKTERLRSEEARNAAHTRMTNARAIDEM